MRTTLILLHAKFGTIMWPHSTNFGLQGMTNTNQEIDDMYSTSK